MTGVPEGLHARDFTLTARMTQADRKELEAGKRARGARSASAYIRQLIQEDSKKRAEQKENG